MKDRKVCVIMGMEEPAYTKAVNVLLEGGFTISLSLEQRMLFDNDLVMVKPRVDDPGSVNNIIQTVRERSGREVPILLLTDRKVKFVNLDGGIWLAPIEDIGTQLGEYLKKTNPNG